MDGTGRKGKETLSGHLGGTGSEREFVNSVEIVPLEEWKKRLRNKNFQNIQSSLIKQILEALTKQLGSSSLKSVLHRHAERNKLLNLQGAVSDEQISQLIKIHCSKEMVRIFEREFETRLAALDDASEVKKKLKPGKGIYQSMFFRWMFSLCTIASMAYVDDSPLGNNNSGSLMFS